MQKPDYKTRKKALSLTTAEVAYMANLPVSTVSKIMTGETKHPTAITIEKIESVFHKEESRKRLEAYLLAMKDYLMEHRDEDFSSEEFEKSYRAKHSLENKPIAEADSLSEPYPIWGNVALKKRLSTSVKDYFKMSIENRWVELADGNIIVNEAPGMAHQLLVKSINKQIESFIDDNAGKCQVFDMGINVRLDEEEDTILIPDILVICDKDKIKDFGILGAPDWVIEVVSPSTRQYDYKKKTYKYLSHGVRELWLVDPEKKVVVTYIDGEYMMSHLYQFGDSIPVSIYDGKLKIVVQ